jgi:hypothetical protein
VTRFDTGVRGISWLRSATLLGLGGLLSACGGGSMPPQPTGVNAILNGSTLAKATSHWVSKSCAIQAELTSDHGFLSVVTNTSGDTTTASLTWTPSVSQNSVTVSSLGGEGGTFWITSMSGIGGSVASQQFTAAVTVETQDTPQNLGNCTFSLTQGGLSLPGS